jgi:hypothetical protein
VNRPLEVTLVVSDEERRPIPDPAAPTNNRPAPTDTPAKPGETFVLKPDVGSVKGVRRYLEDNVGSSNVETALNSVVLVFQVINFGDGTGYLGATPDKATRKVM